MGLSVGVTFTALILLVLSVVAIITKVLNRKIRPYSQGRAATAVNSSVLAQPSAVTTQSGTRYIPSVHPTTIQFKGGELFATEPPSYASAMADDSRYVTPAPPPPYPGLKN